MRLTIHSDGYQGFKKRSMERARKFDSGETVAPSKSITFESPMDIFSGADGGADAAVRCGAAQAALGDGACSGGA